MAVGDLAGVAGVCLAGDSRLTWVVGEVPVESDSVVVVEAGGGQHRIGRVRVLPGGIVAGTVEPDGSIVALATVTDIESETPQVTELSDKRLGGIGRIIRTITTADRVHGNPLVDEFNARLPRLGDRVQTEQGEGVVVRLYVSEARMTVHLDSGETAELERQPGA